ncbi:sulfurtransferase [Altererythrobacter sp. B11]|uniref:3-mercaptopyruvate sulfurtransferase n=1 Tax=Altererythrobacter sp. B11 TaxID=2060312 RepID=UPI000DC7196B|nr:3-mercaptopyruvate sulfurtransferase [Altererythrobacter sp. B11]BBC74096.1 sulfurtransferase [Altererythrobacter sp. B11]
MEELVSTEWLAGQIGAPDLAILDASAHLPDAGRDPAAEFAAAHIPGARYLDLATLKDGNSPVPAALPTAAQLAERMAALGVRHDQRIVIYDDSEVKTSARAWFILRMHGARNVAILDGGLGKWRAEGRPLEAGMPSTAPVPFAPAAGPGAVRSKADILANLASAQEQVVDARGALRFRGEAPDFRPGVAEGHIPGSRNLPFGGVLNEDGTFKDAAGIRAAFAQAGVDLDQPVVTTCGSGVTAAVLLFALHLIGKDDTALYDGSWSEWGADPDTPKATGEAV